MLPWKQDVVPRCRPCPVAGLGSRDWAATWARIQGLGWNLGCIPRAGLEPVLGSNKGCGRTWASFLGLAWNSGQIPRAGLDPGLGSKGEAATWARFQGRGKNMQEPGLGFNREAAGLDDWSLGSVPMDAQVLQRAGLPGLGSRGSAGTWPWLQGLRRNPGP